jgi:two-component system chemotaxis sensor kinase CheA
VYVRFLQPEARRPMSPSSVPLGGSLTIATAEATHAKLIEALGGASPITLDCSQASEIDVTFLQLMVAAQRTAAGAGKTVRLAAAPGGVLADALRRCGFPPAGAAVELAEILASDPERAP